MTCFIFLLILFNHLKMSHYSWFAGSTKTGSGPYLARGPQLAKLTLGVEVSVRTEDILNSQPLEA